MASAQSCIQVFSNYSLSKTQIEDAKRIYKDGVYVAKRGKYEALRIGMFSNHQNAKDYISKNSSIFKNAIIIDDCTNDNNLPLIGSNHTKEYSTEEIRVIKPTDIKVEEVKTNYVVNTASVFNEKPADENIFDHYNFSRYFSKLLTEDEAIENSYYTNKIESINQLLRESTYNSNLYFTATSNYTKDHSLSQKDEAHQTDLFLNWEYRLYDGQMRYVYDEVRKIKEQGAMVTYEDEKSNLALLGADIYGNLLFTQTILSIYKELYESQKSLYEIIYANRKKGIFSAVDEIDAKDDVIELEKSIIAYETEHLRNTYIVKSSINSKSEKPLYVAPLNINTIDYSSDEAKKLIIHNSPLVAKAQNALKDIKSTLILESARREPKVDLDAFTGYTFLRDIDANINSDGTNSGIGIEINIPIYEKNEVYLNEQKYKIQIIQAKNDLKIAIKNSLDQWDNHEKTTTQLEKVYALLTKQLEGQDKKLNIIRKNYLAGNADYRDYKDALNKVILLNVELISNVISQEKRKLIGNYLLGKKVYNVKN